MSESAESASTPPPAAAPLWTPTQPFVPTPAPSAFVAPEPPAEPVLPPPHPSELFEPAVDAANVPTTKLDTAEMAAQLAARAGDPDPLATPEIVTPSVPAAAVEATASATPAALPEPEPTASSPGEADADASDAGAPDADDGLAALFGDVAEPETETEPETELEPDMTAAAPIAGAAASPEPPIAVEPPLFREFPPFEPSAAVEGPQFTEPVTVPQETLPAPVFAADPTVAIPSAATPPTAPPPVDGSPTTVLPGAPAGPGGPGDGSTPPPRPRDPRKTRTLFLVAGILAVILVLIGLFALGTRLPSLFGAAQSTAKTSSASTPSATPTPTPTPTPTVTPKPAAPAAAGVQAWDALGGGECIEPYTTPWAESFTVVDCATPHTAQMVYTGILNPDIAAAYPGADALAQQINGLCTAPGVIDLNAAGAYTGLQVQGTFPATEEQWKDGQRSYYCFASRSTGEPMTSSVAGPGPAA